MKGNVQHKKKIDKTIKIISKLNKILKKKVILKIFGAKREPLFSELKKLVKEYDVEKNVKFMGFKDPIDIWIQRSDIMLTTGKNEALGRSILEAMSMGIPVIASKHGGNGEIIKHRKNGLLVDLGDIDGYAKAIKKIHTNINLRNKITKLAKKTIRKKFSLEQHINCMDNVYKKVIKK